MSRLKPRRKPIHGVDEPHSGVGRLRVSDTFLVRAYYTSHGGRLVRLRMANGSHYYSQ
jgi:hypothetical protein